jgi:AraC-like DNA-binding protein
MVDLVTRRPVNYEWHLHEMITRVLGQLLAVRKVLIQPDNNGAPPRPVTRVLQAVLSDPARAWRAAELASLAEVSYSGLRSLFRESQHESLSEFLRRVRLDQAKLLLLDERLAVKEISSKLGFSSEFYFSQWFRRETGISPTHFRGSLGEG